MLSFNYQIDTELEIAMNLKDWQHKNLCSEGRTPFYVPRTMKHVVSVTNAQWVADYQERAENVKALAMNLLNAWTEWAAVPVVENRGELHPLDQKMASALVQLREALVWFGVGKFGGEDWAKGEMLRKARNADVYFTAGIDNAIMLLKDAGQYHTHRDWTEDADHWVEIYSRS